LGANAAKDLAAANKIGLRRRRYLSLFGEGRIGKDDVAVILPQTYMNLSGDAVLSIVKDKDIVLSDMLVICDDADLSLGKLRIRPKGSSGGHRGLRSIIERLGSESFPRLRIGIGKHKDMVRHVLGAFGRAEFKKAEEAEEAAAEAALCWLTKGIKEAMNIYNAPGAR